ncbi:hypothetical protein BDN72DRAFT_835715 [Pluteus cervinus]|uniref:Uncharacterized protein n=1 Tax=Pluteus cervinus TaxID=181527 RepID=A0ACD3B476_9AGAR|nr:hypothetical protein BDN72DRAFT_835715 [Pluteus cervinus]
MAPAFKAIVDFVTSNLIIRDLSPSPNIANVDLHEMFACYGLPYGAIGFISHLLTYWTVFCLWFGRKPLWPLRPVSYSRFDLALGIVSLVSSTTLAIITLARCRNQLQLVEIAVWKVGMSLVNGLTSISEAELAAEAEFSLFGTLRGSELVPLHLPKASNSATTSRRPAQKISQRSAVTG